MKEEKAGLKFLLIIAAKEVLNCEVRFCHSLDTGIRGIFLTDYKVTSNDIRNITNKMKEYINSNYPILKLNVSSKDAMSYYNNAIELCDENEDFPAAALIFSKIGYVRYKLNFIDEAQFYFLKSIKAYEKSIFVWGRAEVYYYLYKIYKEKNNICKASMYYEQALRFVDKYSSEDAEIIDAIK